MSGREFSDISMKKKEIGMFRHRNSNTRTSEEYIDNSVFINTLGSMPSGYEHRKEYIVANKEEEEVILMHLISIAYPDNKNRWCAYRNSAMESKELNTVVLYTCFKKALESWVKGTGQVTGKLFRNYVLDEYAIEAYGDLNKYNDSMGLTSTVAVILKKAKRIMSENEADIYWAVEVLREDPQYSTTRESTWQAVIDAYIAINEKVYLNSKLYTETDGKAIETIETIGIEEQPDYLREEERREDEDTLAARFNFYADDIENASVIGRKWMMRGKTCIILRALKYKDSKPVNAYPACILENYEALKRSGVVLMNRIFDIGLIKYLIEEQPDAIGTFKGVSFNMFIPGREVTNQCLVNFINDTEKRKTPITEESVSRSLKTYGVSFSGYSVK